MLALSRPSIFKHCVWHLILKKGNTAFKNLLIKFNINGSKINAILKTCKFFKKFIFRSLKTPAFKGFDNSAGSYNSACKMESGRKPVLFMLGNLVFSLLT